MGKNTEVLFCLLGTDIANNKEFVVVEAVVVVALEVVVFTVDSLYPRYFSIVSVPPVEV